MGRRWFCGQAVSNLTNQELQHLRPRVGWGRGLIQQAQSGLVHVTEPQKLLILLKVELKTGWISLYKDHVDPQILSPTLQQAQEASRSFTLHRMTQAGSDGGGIEHFREGRGLNKSPYLAQLPGCWQPTSVPTKQKMHRCL